LSVCPTDTTHCLGGRSDHKRTIYHCQRGDLGRSRHIMPSRGNMEKAHTPGNMPWPGICIENPLAVHSPDLRRPGTDGDPHGTSPTWGQNETRRADSTSVRPRAACAGAAPTHQGENAATARVRKYGPLSGSSPLLTELTTAPYSFQAIEDARAKRMATERAAKDAKRAAKEAERAAKDAARAARNTARATDNRKGVAGIGASRVLANPGQGNAAPTGSEYEQTGSRSSRKGTAETPSGGEKSDRVTCGCIPGTRRSQRVKTRNHGSARQSKNPEPDCGLDQPRRAPVATLRVQSRHASANPSQRASHPSQHKERPPAVIDDQHFEEQTSSHLEPSTRIPNPAGPDYESSLIDSESRLELDHFARKRSSGYDGDKSNAADIWTTKLPSSLRGDSRPVLQRSGGRPPPGGFTRNLSNSQSTR
jgi:hypothetical protein